MTYPIDGFISNKATDDHKERITRSAQIADRLSQIADEIEDDNANLDALLQETRALKTEQGALREQGAQRQKILEDVAAGAGQTAFRFPDGMDRTPEQATRDTFKDKVMFRSGERISDKYPDKINADKCLRAAITIRFLAGSVPTVISDTPHILSKMGG